MVFSGVLLKSKAILLTTSYDYIADLAFYKVWPLLENQTESIYKQKLQLSGIRVVILKHAFFSHLELVSGP